MLLPKQRYSEERKAEVLRGLSGAFLAAGTQPHLRDHTQNDHAVVKKKLLSLPTVKETLFAAKASAVLELDEV